MRNMSEISHNEVGKIGEDTACRFLMKRGFKIEDHVPELKAFMK